MQAEFYFSNADGVCSHNVPNNILIKADMWQEYTWPISTGEETLDLAANMIESVLIANAYAGKLADPVLNGYRPFELTMFAYYNFWWMILIPMFESGNDFVIPYSWVLEFIADQIGQE